MQIILPGPTVPTRTDGVCAEYYSSGALKHLGCYRDGKPRGWVLDLAENAPEGTLTKREEYQVEQEPYFEWVENWVRLIFEEADYVLRCSFCAKTRNEVRKLIAGPTCYICDECVKLCQEILAEEVV